MSCTFSFLPKNSMKDFTSTTELVKVKFSKILHICHFEKLFLLSSLDSLWCSRNRRHAPCWDKIEYEEAEMACFEMGPAICKLAESIFWSVRKHFLRNNIFNFQRLSSSHLSYADRVKLTSICWKYMPVEKKPHSHKFIDTSHYNKERRPISRLSMIDRRGDICY